MTLGGVKIVPTETDKLLASNRTHCSEHDYDVHKEKSPPKSVFGKVLDKWMSMKIRPFIRVKNKNEEEGIIEDSPPVNAVEVGITGTF